ncbi:hypothetical protein [Amycolatopsis sp. cmx-11-51]|uniref:hypothetical protein n=1 Tax=Amycolatopsis sp. cmx-11-51 TaxID=2785797 RepID=UPI0039E3111C
MDFAQALAADELWGWPVEVLDRLFELRSRAGAGLLGIEEWREQDASLRAGMPEVGLEEANDFLIDWMVNGRYIESPLTGRLSALCSPPPTDEELWSEVASIDVALADRKTPRRTKDAYRTSRARAVGWLTRPGSGLDWVTGLPWSVIGRYRVVDNLELGPVPQVVDSARQLALLNASSVERERAALVAQDRSAAEVALADAKADMSQHRVTWFPDLLSSGVEGDEGLRPLLGEVVCVWSDPRVQRLLMDETSAGWPEPLKQEGSGGDGQAV